MTMWTREEVLAFLDEPYVTLSDAQRAAAEAMAASDPEVADALWAGRSLARLDESALFGGPAATDAAFLVALRDRISTTQPSVRRGAFGSVRLAGLAASVCAVLMAVILGAGNHFTPSPEALEDTAVLTFAAALETAPPLLLDSLEEDAVNPDSLATYLDIPELSEEWDFGDVAMGPLSDELLSLDPQTIEEVLAELEQTDFF